MEKPGSCFALAKGVKCMSVTCIFTKNITILTVFLTHFVGAHQESSFSINGTLNVNTQSVQEKIKLKIAKIHPNNTILSGKKPSMAILRSEICKIDQILWSTFFNYIMIHSSKTPYDVLYITI